MEASFYPYLGALCWIGMLLMLGTLIRAKVPLFQKLLFPSSLIGGLIGFVLINLDLVGMPTSTGWKDITPNIFSMITFHLFAFGFVGIGLLQTKKPASGKVVMRGALWIALVFGMTFSVQALIGKGVFVLWQDLFGGTFETVNGYLLGAGFTQGPGQTQAYATIWQTSYQTANALSVGLAFAAVVTTPGMAALDLPILFFHGDADTFVPLHHSERNLAACRRPQRLVVIPGAEHAMSAQGDPERYRHELLTFLWRNTNYLWDERNKPLK